LPPFHAHLIRGARTAWYELSGRQWPDLITQEGNELLRIGEAGKVTAVDGDECLDGRARILDISLRGAEGYLAEAAMEAKDDRIARGAAAGSSVAG
jgi:hypothetical protein